MESPSGSYGQEGMVKGRENTSRISTDGAIAAVLSR